MKKTLSKISFLLFALIVLCSIGILTCHYGVGLVVHAEEIEYNNTDFLDGNGTESSPFLIANKYQFDNIRNYPDSYFKLVSNIKFLDADFQSGGAFYNNGNLFKVSERQKPHSLDI